MNPVRFIKIFFSIFVFIFLAGFSSSSFAQSMELRIRLDSSPTSGGLYFYYPLGTDRNSAMDSALPFVWPGHPSPFVEWVSYPSPGGVQNASARDENGYSVIFRIRYTSSSLPPDQPEPEPEPLEPDDPYCLDNPMNPLCSPEEPTPEECALGVGSQACCASYARNACYPDSVAWWSAGYGLGSFVTSCSYSCSYPAEPSPDPLEPDPYDPPVPDDPNLNPSNPVSPGDPSNPSLPSDPNDPVSVDLSGVNERLEILSNLNTDGFNTLNQNIYQLDANNQTGFANVRRSIDSGFGDLGRRLDPSGSPSFDPNAFQGVGGFTDADSDEMKGLLGITGDESFGDLERTIDLGDYSDDYSFTLPDSTCPAPRQIELSFGTFELSYEPMCEIFDYVGLLVVLTALFLTPIIVFRGL